MYEFFPLYKNRPKELYRNKIAWLNILFAIFIVICHTVNIKIYHIESSFLFSLETLIGETSNLIVPAFYVLSGFLFFQNLKWSTLKNKLLSRFKGLVLPYIAWGALAYFFNLIIHMFPMIRAHMNHTVDPFTFQNLLNAVFFQTYDGPLWFLQYLIGYMILTPFMFIFLENPLSTKFHSAYKIVIPVVLAGMSLFIGNNFLKYAVPFICGGYLGRYHKDIVKKKYPQAVRTIAGLILLLSIFLRKFIDFRHFYMIIRIFQVKMIWISTDFLASARPPKEWMKISFVVFCSHNLILEPLEKLFLLLLGNNLFGAWIDFLCAPVITLSIICAFSCLCKKIPVLWKVLSGGR